MPLVMIMKVPAPVITTAQVKATPPAATQPPVQNHPQAA